MEQRQVMEVADELIRETRGAMVKLHPGGKLRGTIDVVDGKWDGEEVSLTRTDRMQLLDQSLDTLRLSLGNAELFESRDRFTNQFKEEFKKRLILEQYRNDLRLIDSAIDMLSIERNLKAGDPISPTELAQFFYPTMAKRFLTGSAAVDRLGIPFPEFASGQPPQIPREAITRLPSVPDEFRKPYQVEGKTQVD